MHSTDEHSYQTAILFHLVSALLYRECTWTGPVYCSPSFSPFTWFVPLFLAGLNLPLPVVPPPPLARPLTAPTSSTSVPTCRTSKLTTTTTLKPCTSTAFTWSVLLPFPSPSPGDLPPLVTLQFLTNRHRSLLCQKRPTHMIRFAAWSARFTCVLARLHHRFNKSPTKNPQRNPRQNLQHLWPSSRNVESRYSS